MKHVKNCIQRVKSDYKQACAKALYVEKILDWLTGLIPVGFTIATLTLFVSGGNHIDRLSQITANIFFNTEEKTGITEKQITVITIDDSIFREFKSGIQYRGMLGCLSNSLIEKGAKVVGLDFDFSKKITTTSDKDIEILEKFRGNIFSDKIVIASTLYSGLGDNDLIESIPIFDDRIEHNANAGFSSFKYVEGGNSLFLNPLVASKLPSAAWQLTPSFGTLLWLEAEHGISRHSEPAFNKQCMSASGCLSGGDTSKPVKNLLKELKSESPIYLRTPKRENIMNVLPLAAYRSPTTPLECGFRLPKVLVNGKIVIVGENLNISSDKINNPLYFDLSPIPLYFSGDGSLQTWPGVYFHAFSVWNHLKNFPMNRYDESSRILTLTIICLAFLIFYASTRGAKLFKKITHSVKDNSFLSSQFIMMFTSILVVSVIIFLEGYMISINRAFFHPSEIVPSFLLFCTAMIMLDRFLHYLVEGADLNGFDRHLLFPDNRHHLDNLLGQIGSSMQGVLLTFELDMRSMNDPIKAEATISRCLEHVRGTLQSEYLGANSIYLDREIPAIFCSHHRNKVSVILPYLDISNAGSIAKLADRITVTSPNLAIAKHSTNFGTFTVLNIYNKLEEGVLTFTGDIWASQT